jgi:4-amino-4-deoxy-L-arabinose transferase-like glycosyltransferase
MACVMASSYFLVWTATAHFNITTLNLRDKFLLAVLIPAGWMWFVFQAGSLFHALTPVVMYITWTFFVLITLGMAISLRRRNGFPALPIDKIREWFLSLRSLTVFQKIITSLIVVFFLALALIGFIYPSSYADSMTYHLPRVLHWAENRSVFPYATAILRQVQMPPFAEYQILNLFLLSGGDRLAAWVELFSFFGCFVGVTNIARKLGANNHQQLLSGLFCLSLPTAILQSTATQNDVVAAFWVILLANFILAWILEPDQWRYAIPVGLSLGLALFTKATAFIFAFPLCVWLAIHLLKHSKRNIFWGLLAMLIALTINLPQYLWNYRLFNNPMGTTRGYLNQSIAPQFIISNLIRDTDEQLQLSLSANDDCNNLLHQGLMNLHRLTGLTDDDMRNTYYSTSGFACGRYPSTLYEASTAHPLQYGILVILLICLPFNIKKINRIGIEYLAVVILTYLLFHTVFTFQLAGVRLQIGIMMLAIPLIIEFDRFLHRYFTSILVIFLFLLSFYWVGNNIYRPLSISQMRNAFSHRVDAIFIDYQKPLDNTESIADKIVALNCHVIGLEYGSDVWEYPFWSALSEKGWTGKIEYRNIRNETNSLTASNYYPCAIITNDVDKRSAAHPTYQVLRGDPFSLLYK